jgi:hypothetical protein
MEKWKYLLNELRSADIESIKEKARADFDKYQVYPDSIYKLENSFFLVAVQGQTKILVVTGDKRERFNGEEEENAGLKIRKCPMDNINCAIIRSLFDFTNPVYNKSSKISMGFGDRLGVASPGHIRMIKNLPIFPILAQQSVRELNLTNRSFTDVLSAASWAVFQEGYTKGFGADGDHLKSHEEVEAALEAGFTMITLDCSEHIRNDLEGLSEPELKEQYDEIADDEKKRMEVEYLGRTFPLQGDYQITFSGSIFYKIVLTYYRAILFMEEIYQRHIVPSRTHIDFEVSIDETIAATSPEAHFFVSMELKKHHVTCMSVAPHFYGEFQKGIDYIGDLSRFEKEYLLHEQIAREFGYKLSIHSGSDKFSVFGTIGRNSPGYHLKTAGTNWLEAVRLIAQKRPGLYRGMHRFAREHFNEATKYYHVTTDLEKVPDVNQIEDSQLASLMELNDTRQMMHITYGLLLQSKNPDGTSTFKDEIYKILFEFESVYYNLLEIHLGRHIDCLGIHQNHAEI